ncbi:hypothetical protein I4U23_021870 [Adineta vaga]|nr:hypothetical protein I4U23_021870 [Adineta vaga]
MFCKAASFSQLTYRCDLFDTLTVSNENMLADINTISMIVMSGTRLPSDEHKYHMICRETQHKEFILHYNSFGFILFSSEIEPTMTSITPASSTTLMSASINTPSTSTSQSTTTTSSSLSTLTSDSTTFQSTTPSSSSSTSTSDSTTSSSSSSTSTSDSTTSTSTTTTITTSSSSSTSTSDSSTSTSTTATTTSSSSSTSTSDSSTSTSTTTTTTSSSSSSTSTSDSTTSTSTSTTTVTTTATTTSSSSSTSTSDSTTSSSSSTSTSDSTTSSSSSTSTSDTTTSQSTTSSTSATTTSTTSSSSTSKTTTSQSTTSSMTTTSSTSTTATSTTSSSSTSTSTTTAPPCPWGGIPLTFDNIPAADPVQGILPSNYGGLNWTNGKYINATAFSTTGCIYARTSGDYVSFLKSTVIIETSPNNSTIQVISWQLSSAYANGNRLLVTGYYSSTQLYNITIPLNVYSRYSQVFNWTGLNKIVLQPTGTGYWDTCLDNLCIIF